MIGKPNAEMIKVEENAHQKIWVYNPGSTGVVNV
jgi:hypothetical protein